ncbi:hypothetical protein [Chryseobacterium indoltheticum]|uniref:hypothetical protein n=1 Tax=Chryseobacterium indoltheticum TaxID=254 RepID=UPI003F491202
MKDKELTIFGITKDELFDFETNKTFKHKEEFRWIRQLLIYFYHSLKEYKRRYSDNLITELSHSIELNTNLGDNEYTYLDLLLSFVNYYKKIKILFYLSILTLSLIRLKMPNGKKQLENRCQCLIQHMFLFTQKLKTRKR